MLCSLKQGWDHAAKTESGFLRRGALCALWLVATDDVRHGWTEQRDNYLFHHPEGKRVEQQNRQSDEEVLFYARECNLRSKSLMYKATSFLGLFI